MEPLLYHTIALEYTAAIDGYPIFTWPVLLSAIRTKPASFFRNSVRNICILFNEGLQDDLETLLSVCTGVQNFSLARGVNGSGVPLDEYSLITPLRLKQFYGTLNPIASKPIGPYSSFAHITHLGLVAWEVGPSLEDAVLPTCSHLALMPQLTHLSLDADCYIQQCLYILEMCKSLQVVVAFWPPDEPLATDDETALSRDMRFVVMWVGNFLKDWQIGTFTGADYWARAEDFVAKRRSGKINGTQLCLI